MHYGILTTQFGYDDTNKLQKQELCMNLWMDPQGNQLKTCPMQTYLECTIEPYASSQFEFIENLDRQFRSGSVWTWTRTRSDGPEWLLILGTCRYSGVDKELCCGGGEWEMKVSLLMRLCRTPSWHPAVTNWLFHPLVFTYFLTSNYSLIFLSSGWT